MSKEIHGKVTTHQKVRGEIVPVKSGGSGSDDYNHLKNKPSIEGVTLIGDKLLSDFGITYIYQETTEYWNSKPSLKSKKGAIYIYTDYQQDDDGKNIPGCKLGDGKAYLIDMPFCDENYRDHIMNDVIHITEEERAKWNNKVSCHMDTLDNELLIFTTD